MHLVDQATLEMFVSVLLDENEHCDAEDEKLYEYRGTQVEGDPFSRVNVSGDWATIKEVSEAANFVEGTVLPGGELSLSISKKRSAFCIEVNKPRPADDVTAESVEEGAERPDEALEIRVDPLAGDS